MSETRGKSRIPRFFTFDAIDLNTYLVAEGIAADTKRMGEFFRDMLADLLSGCVRGKCDRFVRDQIYANAENRMEARRRRNAEYYERKKAGKPAASPAPVVEDVGARKGYGVKGNVMLSDEEVEAIRSAYPDATDKDFRVAVDRVSLKWSGRFEKPGSWTKCVSGAVEQILIARRDDKLYMQKEGFRKEREERKAEASRMTAAMRAAVDLGDERKAAVPDEFEVPF